MPCSLKILAGIVYIRIEPTITTMAMASKIPNRVAIPPAPAIPDTNNKLLKLLSTNYNLRCYYIKVFENTQVRKRSCENLHIIFHEVKRK